MEEKYKYLFPYEKVRPGSDILIYGAGALGQDYLRQMQITGYCNVVGFVDRNHESYPPMAVPVYGPGDIHTLQFDCVVIALRMAASFNEIKRVLLGQGVAEQDMVAVFERKYSDGVSGGSGEEGGSLPAPAFRKGAVPFAVLATGGLGDMVIQKKLIMELIRQVPDCLIDIYNIKATAFLEYLYRDVPNVNAVIPDLGVRYTRNKSSYLLGMTVEACHFLTVDALDARRFPAEYADFAENMRRLCLACMEEKVDIQTPAHVTLYRRLFQGCNAYTGFGYGGIFDIRDKKVEIPLPEDAGAYFRSLGYTDYITVNYGNGDCMDGGMVAKTWPLAYFEEFVSLFGKRYPRIRVVQLGAAGAERIGGCDAYHLGEGFPAVAHILKNARFHLDIEGGLVHIATQLGTKCIVLFGPTVKEYYGYDENINVSVGTCHGCWGLYTDVNRCARGMAQPECMYGITPRLVMEHAAAYLDTLGGDWDGERQKDTGSR